MAVNKLEKGLENLLKKQGVKLRKMNSYYPKEIKECLGEIRERAAIINNLTIDYSYDHSPFETETIELYSDRDATFHLLSFKVEYTNQKDKANVDNTCLGVCNSIREIIPEYKGLFANMDSKFIAVDGSVANSLFEDRGYKIYENAISIEKFLTELNQLLKDHKKGAKN